MNLAWNRTRTSSISTGSWSMAFSGFTCLRCAARIHEAPRNVLKSQGIDATSIDSCELYSQENGFPVNRTLVVEVDETMGRTRSAKNFALVLEDKEAPLNVPSEAHTLMKIIDAIYASAESGRPVELA
jgi:predicted dehydrogenase